MTERKIKYVVGDATEPQRLDENKIAVIPHCCNDIGAWGAGFVLALSRKWKEPEQHYLAAFSSKTNKPKLGDVQTVIVDRNVVIANIIGQKGVLNKNNLKPVRYYAIRNGLNILTKALPRNCEFHMPRMGCGLAGGNWADIEEIIKEIVLPKFDVVVYDLA